MKAIALINPAAGSVGADGRRRLQNVFSGAGLGNADIVTFDPDAGLSQMRKLIASEPDVLVVWGGDGTHRTALTAAGNKFSRLLLLPGGTMNLLTKWIHGPKPWDVVLRSALAGRTQRVLDAGAVGEELFFCAMLAGVPAQFAQAREDVRAGNLGRAFHDVGVALDVAHHLHLKAQADDTTDLPQGNVVAALIGPLSRASGQMEVGGLSVPTTVAALSFAWTCVRSDWDHQTGADLRPAGRITVSDPQGRDIPVIMDGEHVDLGSRFTAAYRANAATCMVAV